jgi:23S rRNA (cytidine1920-2'-O)/16S rRNA (cytidine1409-2'-O)-methyltransferase
VASHRARFVALINLLARHQIEDDSNVIASGRVLVDGRVISNPAARVRADAALKILPARRLRGDLKLSEALRDLAVPVATRVTLDVGASAGGFTTALLTFGARRVYAVEAGLGQLVGSLRIDPRVVNLEGHNLGELSPRVVPEAVEVITMDLSYLALADAVPQLEVLDIDHVADLVALVKPTFELHRGVLVSSATEVAAAVDRAAEGMSSSGWEVRGACPAPRTGRKGAPEVFMYAHRRERRPNSPRGEFGQSFRESVMEGSASPLSGEVVTPVPMARNSVACSPQMWLYTPALTPTIPSAPWWAASSSIRVMANSRAV